MSVDETNVVEPSSPLDDLPQFDLDYQFDDPVEPTEVTVFDPGAGDETTSWITAAVADSIDLVDVS